MSRKTKAGDFFIVDAIKERLEIDDRYRSIVHHGFTTDGDGLLDNANRLIHCTKPLYQCQDVEEAIKILTEGGWIILRFLN